jgi:hypothetical protein
VAPVLSFVLACASQPAWAQTGWTFSYTGFLLHETGEFQPGYRLDGSFRGTDTNADGVLSRDELTMFVWGDYNYFEVEGRGCTGSWCELKSFSYDLDKRQLSFAADWHYSDEALYVSTETVTGLSHIWYQARGYPRMDEESTYTYRWTDQTRFAISPPPVPEPAMPALLAGGLVLFGAARLRGLRRTADGAVRSTSSAIAGKPLG